MNFVKTAIDGVYIVEPRIFEDARGYFFESYNEAEFIKNGICSIGIYPEGWVSKSGELLEFRHGSFRIAKKAECPVVVAHISGTDKILKKPIWKKAEVLLEIKGVIDTEFIKAHKTIEISDFARKIMTQ